MTIWVDADACPGPVKNILYRAAERTQLQMFLVANRPLRVPSSDYIATRLVPQGCDVADDEIVRQVAAGDLVITADIPLAASAIGKGAVVITPFGKLLDEHTIGEQLSISNFLDELRGSGVETGGPQPFSARDKERFANALSGFLGG
ncbi:YaiI/YqxD family protein [bacterium]|nr:YaiI/YqxD family protein [bacterium]